MAVKLGVNVDHVATIRQARGTRYPEPLQAALLAEQAGADQITIHLREDRRHIQDRDLRMMRDVVQTRLNLEMAATAEMLQIARAVAPETVTLVPERREEQTTEGGLDLATHRQTVTNAVEVLHEAGISVSLFIDPTEQAVTISNEMGADAVELHTGELCDAPDSARRSMELEKVAQAARYGRKLGLYMAAGHGLDYHNVKQILTIAEIEELNIGHSIVARALFVGFERAVREMVALLRG